MGSMVQHNIVAMNANRNLNVTTASQAKSTEKLSTGYKINRAADDAAGLSISEKMRRQIRGLTQASANAQDGISSVQTAEGALTEVHDMLQRMDELATKASNGTLSEGDRSNVQDEIDNLLTEIDRVSETTKFNEIYLLKGNVDGNKSSIKVNAHDAGLAGTLTDNGGTANFKLTDSLSAGDSVTIGGTKYTIDDGTPFAGLNNSTSGYKKFDDATFTGTQLKAGDTISHDGVVYTMTDSIDVASLTFSAGASFKIGDKSYAVSTGLTGKSFSDNGTKYLVTSDYARTLMLDALAAGKQVKTANDRVKAWTYSMGTINSTSVASKLTANTKIVASLGSNEINIQKIQGADTSAYATKALLAVTGNSVIKEGDAVTHDGQQTIATDATPAAARAIATAISNLSSNNTVKIGSGTDAVTWTIADETDEANFKITKSDILSKINNYDEVTIHGGAAAQTVIGSLTEKDPNVISIADAYSKMADALKQASSIGANEEAKVTNHNNGAFTITKGSVDVKDGLTFDLHVGSDADMTNKISVSIDTMDTAGLGIKGLSVAGKDGSAATYAIDAIEDAIKKVSTQRSALGAVQNRLEHTIKNVDNVVENTTSAESQIRDTDMATEMVTYSKNNILAQAGQSMLAQANQSNQGVLSLLG